MDNFKKASLGLGIFSLSSFALADGATMASEASGIITGNSEALWTIGAAVITLSAIALVISRIKRVTS